MRFNVVYNGKRTTARLPDELWELFVLAMDSDQSRAISEIQSFFEAKEKHRKEYEVVSLDSPSVSVRCFVTGFLRSRLRSPAGFNPGNSRARCPDTGDLLEAAEAKPSTDEHLSPRRGTLRPS